MSRNTIELVAKFRDDASVGLRRLATEANRTMQIQAVRHHLPAGNNS